LVPTIVAESLREIHDPLEAVLRLGPGGPADLVARTIARSLAPREAELRPPAWLRPEQVSPFQRAAAAIARYGGAMLADPVGSGKTWIALAVAQALAPQGPVVALVPAALQPQWRDTARRVGVRLILLSHQAASRGRLPPERPALALIDESHHFRNPATRRYACVAPWLVHAPVLLASGTPVVNRLDDLAHQLLLAVRDDCLAGRGCPSLLEALSRGQPPPALGDLVFCRPAPAAIPRAATAILRHPMGSAERALLEGIDRLSLSPDRGVAGLIRVVFLRALASSPAALAGALRRYERLLHHAAQAAGSGTELTRATIRAFTGPDQEQLVLWEMLCEAAGSADLSLADEAPVAALLTAASDAARRPDGKSERLDAIVSDGLPTIVFTTFRDSLAWLRNRLAGRRPAWITGDGAGLGPATLDREAVLSWFRPEQRSTMQGFRRPTILLTTDVAAEGLDLQGAGRIVHYDLPWTSVRIDQRNGRALRLGTRWDDIPIVEFHPPPDLEIRLGQLERLARKRCLASHAGVAPDGHWLYRWRGDLAAWAGAVPHGSRMSVVTGDQPGWLFGLALDLVDERGVTAPMPASLLWIREDGSVSESPEQLAELLCHVAGRPWRAPSAADRRRALAVLLPVVRLRLREAATALWRAPRRTPDHRVLERRLRSLAKVAARRREHGTLVRIDAIHGWLAGGLTAGEAILIRQAADLERRALLSLLAGLAIPPRRRETAVPRVTGVVRVASFTGCAPSEPCSSISTGR
jgi:hypothetical protein